LFDNILNFDHALFVHGRVGNDSLVVTVDVRLFAMQHTEYGNDHCVTSLFVLGFLLVF
jgi:hypothetical protein